MKPETIEQDAKLGSDMITIYGDALVSDALVSDVHSHTCGYCGKIFIHTVCEDPEIMSDCGICGRASRNR